MNLTELNLTELNLTELNLTALKSTALHEVHRQAGARMVDFGGWDMPVHYGSQIEEHHAVRQHAGIFDVSHMLSIDVAGPQAQLFLQYLLANDVERLDVARLDPQESSSEGLCSALYSCMLNPAGGVIDDLIVYRLARQRYRLVVNAGTAQKDIAWIESVQPSGKYDVTLKARHDLGILAVQGPQARRLVNQVRPGWEAANALLKPFTACEIDQVLLARTGYTGEDGLEIILPQEQIASLWHDLVSVGVKPCGLGARDTLRLEAGMNLYGQDMDEQTNPLEAGLAWTIDRRNATRQFIGRVALENFQSKLHLVGLKLSQGGILRAHMAVRTPFGSGEITSGSFSPTLGFSIALARVPLQVSIGSQIEVDMRGRYLSATVVKIPFVRHGKALI